MVKISTTGAKRVTKTANMSTTCAKNVQKSGFVRETNDTFSTPKLLRHETHFTYVFLYNDALSLHRIGSVAFRGRLVEDVMKMFAGKGVFPCGDKRRHKDVTNPQGRPE